LAALLPSRVVFEKLIENNGQNSVVLEQEVSFGVEPRTVLKEIWQIENSRNMRLTVINPANQTVVYAALLKDGTISTNVNGQISSRSLSLQFVERFHHIRSLNEAAKIFFELGVTPQNVLSSNPHVKTGSQFTYKEEPFVRLSRTGGVVAYAFGAPSTQESLHPGLWIEQDAFVIRKIKFAESSEVEFLDFTDAGKGFRYPKRKIVKWGDKEVAIQFKNSATKSLSTNALNLSTLEPVNWLNLNNPANQSLIEEFYSRFR